MGRLTATMNQPVFTVFGATETERDMGAWTLISKVSSADAKAGIELLISRHPRVAEQFGFYRAARDGSPAEFKLTGGKLIQLGCPVCGDMREPLDGWECPGCGTI